MKNFSIFISFLNIFILFFICLEIIKVRWQFSQEYENNAYLKVANNKLMEINLNLKTEFYHLSSPAKVERHVKEILKMEDITKVTTLYYEE
jgi:hypothetical protein|tara:strand:+ start:896 stop:1168 length:273 start_codon:yes stop_codon:yes gene_type:complete